MLRIETRLLCVSLKAKFFTRAAVMLESCYVHKRLAVLFYAPFNCLKYQLSYLGIQNRLRLCVETSEGHGYIEALIGIKDVRFEKMIVVLRQGNAYVLTLHQHEKLGISVDHDHRYHHEAA